MKRSMLLVAAVMLVCLLLLSGCCLEHEWADATCTEPMTCTECGKTEGEALGHEWEDATCTVKKTCSVCGETEGEFLEHEWLEATCTEPKTCAVCGKTQGKENGHEWEPATCTELKYCSVCGDTKGSPLGHEVREWTVELEPSCSAVGTQTGICVRCDDEVSKDIPMLEHTPGEWEVEVMATKTSDGERAQYCAVCGEELARENFELTAEELEAQYKAQCGYYSYDEIARNPYGYSGEYAVFTGEVIQVQKSGAWTNYSYTMRVDVTYNGYYYDDTMYVTCLRNRNLPQILEGDIITMYGELTGEKTYTSILGSSITIPSFHAEYVDIY